MLPGGEWPLGKAADPREVVRQLVASGCTQRTVVQSVSWPSLEVQTFEVEPDLATRDRLLEVARQEELQAQTERRLREFVERRTRVARRREQAAAAEAQREDEKRAHARLRARVLGLAEFRSAIVDGARRTSPWQSSDRLISAFDIVMREAVESFEPRLLVSLLRQAVETRRMSRSPFAGMKEAPPAVNSLFSAHGNRLADTAEEFSLALDAYIGGIASSLYRAVPRPPTWGELMQNGADPAVVPPVDGR